jgi:hypothetical protein
MKKKNRRDLFQMTFFMKVRPYAAHKIALVILLGGILAGSGFVGQAAAQMVRKAVQGRVVTAEDVPIRNAIVYLSDTHTMVVTSYITQADGAYRFEGLSPNDDYKLWAQLDGKKSKTKILSSFEGRRVFHVILKIDTGK